VKPTCLSVTVAALLMPLAAAHADPVPKQLSGPPSEFAQMQVPDPAAAAIHSKSALLPVQFASDKAGNGQWASDLPVENGRLRFLLFAGNDTQAWGVDLVDPQGRRSPATTIAKSARPDVAFGIESATFPASYYAFDGLASGNWRLQLKAGRNAPRDGYVLLEGDPATELASYQTHRRQLVGERIGVAALLTATAGDDIKLASAAGRIDDARLRVTHPDGSIASYAMFDDGRHGDGAAKDGVYGGDFVADSAGRYVAQVIVQGRNAKAQSVVRTAEHVIPVVAPTLRLDAMTKAKASGHVDGRYAISVPVSHDKAGGHYRLHAEVWGRDAKGGSVPVAWVGGMVEAKSGRLELGFDERWVQRAGAQAPFELRNVRADDPEHFITVASAKRLPLSLPAPRHKRAASELAIDESMLMGQRPADLKMAKGTGSRLLLVHGYCSGGVWPAAQFSNASTFLDANQNRSHDQFARLIQSFGSTWNSFGTVAHSQGGAASLHLYTYYWSGLDNAGAGRLIQSVGTPYQGTNLSGILAALGSWFGVGCGTNDNLTYSGAAAWLAGIPTWARSKVNFYTTSFRSTNWWTNDYCNFATDLVLSDPEDGTTEKAYGQLSGAVNRGHVSGQCHTAGMRDPAQYHDSTRNATMNTSAAR